MRSYTYSSYFLLLILVVAGCISEDGTPASPSTVLSTVPATPVIGITLETVTPIRSTPVPFATSESPPEVAVPTEVPTPIYYTVIAGDTLFDIAQSQKTTVEELLRLNPDLDPNLVPIGWQLILPPPDQSLALPTLVEEINSGAQITGINLFDSNTGGLFLFGEVENQGDLALENIQVEITLQNRLTGGQDAFRFWVEPGIVPAGAKAPFGRFLSQAYSEIELTQAHVTAANYVVDLGNRYLDVVVENAEIGNEGRGETLSGVILNTGDRTAIGISLIASLYDEQQTLTGYYQLLVEEPLLPGATQPFEIYILTPGNQVVSFEVLVQGMVESSD